MNRQETYPIPPSRTMIMRNLVCSCGESLEGGYFLKFDGKESTFKCKECWLKG